MGPVGVPIELGLLGLLLASGSLLRLRSDGAEMVYWCLAVVGVVLTPMIWGVPLFGFCFLALTVRRVKQLYNKKVATVL